MFIKLIIAKSNFSKEQNNHVSHIIILDMFIIQFYYKDLKFHFPKIYKFHFPKIYFCLSYPHKNTGPHVIDWKSYLN